MNSGNELLFLLSAIGAFNGLILSGYMFLTNRKKHISTYFFAGLLLALSLRVGKSVLYYFNQDIPKTYLQVGLTACFFIGPFLFFFLKSELEDVKKTPLSWKLTLGILSALILTVGGIYPYSSFPDVWREFIIYCIYFQWGAFLVMSSYLLKNIFWRIGTSEDRLLSFEKWLVTIFIANIIIYSAYLLAVVEHSKYAYISGGLAFSVLLYAIALVLIFRKKTDDLHSSFHQRNLSKKISRQDADFLLNKLDHAVRKNELFATPNLKLTAVASEIKVSDHKLSQLLNDNLGKSFSQFINEYRIEHACEILASDTPYPIEAISFEVGFNSKSTFFSTFKKMKGMTPQNYQNSVQSVKLSSND